MNNKNYSITLVVDQPAKEVFDAVNNISKWWSDDFEGSSQKLEDEFTVRFGDIHVSTQKLVELIPPKKIVWLVTDSRLNFIKDQQEWTNTTIIFEIADKGNKTQIHFTHIGLVPEVECYINCVKGWDYYLKGSLFKFLTEGKGTPGL